MRASPKLIAIGAILSTIGVPVALRYGTVYILMGYLAALLTTYMVLSQRWLWKSAPTEASARAVRTLHRLFWTPSMVFSGLALAAWLYLSTSIFWLLPLPFFVPAAVGTLFYQRTFRRVGNLSFWRKGI